MGKEGKIRSMDNPKRAEVGLVHPVTVAKPYRSRTSSIEIVETVARKKAVSEPASDSGLPEKAEGAPAVSLIIPVFNEEKNLGELISRCLKTCNEMGRSFEIILVDDGSSDGSSKLINEAVDQNEGKVLGVLLNRNYGQHAAVMAGFAESRGDMVVTLDADLQNPPEEVLKLVRAMEEGFDVVGTMRVPRQDTLFRKVASHIINKVAQKATGVKMHDYGHDAMHPKKRGGNA